MGTKCAFTYATLVLGYLVEKLYAKLAETNNLFYDYIKNNVNVFSTIVSFLDESRRRTGKFSCDLE